MRKIVLAFVFISVLLAGLISAGIIPTEDSDNDGVNDSSDLCLGTPAGVIVDSNGCSISQLCPATDNYRNHGSYVSCIAHMANNFVDLGLITDTEKGEIVSEAAQTEIGK